MRTLVQASVLLTAAVFAPAPAGAEESQVSYSADYVMETAEGAVRGKMFVSPGKERREDASADGVSMVTIRRDDLRKMWMLMPAERMYMEMKTGEPDPSGKAATDPGDYDVEMTVVGPERLAGLDTTKQKVVMTGKDGTKMGGFWWTTSEGIPVKMDMLAKEAGSKMRLKRELSNIEIGPQAADLFEIPEGYNSMAAAMGMGAAKGALGIPQGRDGDAADAPAGDAGAAPESEAPPKKKGFGLGTLKDAIDKIR
jgi:hypothetical protein